MQLAVHRAVAATVVLLFVQLGGCGPGTVERPPDDWHLGTWSYISCTRDGVSERCNGTRVAAVELREGGEGTLAVQILPGCSTPPPEESVEWTEADGEVSFSSNGAMMLPDGDPTEVSMMWNGDDCRVLSVDDVGTEREWVRGTLELVPNTAAGACDFFAIAPDGCGEL